MLLINFEVRVFVPEGTSDADAERLTEQARRQMEAWQTNAPRWIEGARVIVTEV